MNLIGIMQGRLVPPVAGKIQAFPRETWVIEFDHAAQAGLGSIEWIYDLYGEDVNPLASFDGIAKLKTLSSRHQVQVRSVCADYFMDKPFVGATAAERRERIQKLEWLLSQCRQLEIKRVVLPFVDQSAMRGASDQACVAGCLKEILPAARRFDIELHLETSLGPADFAVFLSQTPDPFIKVNYDSGNSASLGYRPQDEFAAYGPRIGSVHIKDRIQGGSTVPLGTGHCDFHGLFSELKKMNYQGDFILQVARGTPNDEVAWARKNLDFVLTYWSRQYESVS